MKNMAFVCKQTAVLVVRINKIGQQQRCFHRLVGIFLTNTLPHTSISLTSCISIVFFSFEYFDTYDHYAACWVTLTAD